MVPRLPKLLFMIAVAVTISSTLAGADTRVCGAPGHQHGARLVSDDARGAILLWTDSRTGGSDLYAQHLDPAGEPLWSTDGVAISTSVPTWGPPCLVPDGSGGMLAAWISVWTMTDSICVQRTNASGAPAWTACFVILHRGAGYPSAAPDGAGGIYIAWHNYGLSPSQPDIVYQHLGSGGSLDQGPYGAVLQNGADALYAPGIVPDGLGGAFVSWQSEAVDSVIPWVQHLGWSAMAATTRDLGVWLFRPMALIPDGELGVFLAWPTSNFEDSGLVQDLFVQHLGPGGVEWGASGLRLCGAPGVQESPAGVPDAAGGAIVAWLDRRTGVATIHAQRVAADGNAHWTADGVALCSSCIVASAPEVVSDGAGGAIVVWTDARGGDLDVYGQRITASGSLAWGPEGIPLASGPFDQREPKVVANGFGGAIVAWTDRRNGIDDDIYAQRVNGDGQFPALSARPSPAGMHALTVAPNPLRGSAFIRLGLRTQEIVAVTIRDLSGRLVARVAEREFPAGASTVEWSGRENGMRVPPGVYFVQAITTRESLVQRIVILR